ncbi:gluconokinase [Schlegelella sp. S2-27]|uniref:Gluconokinase n=1 Tax=Caldimonas mangrovi TaxID=2944811 RepID=A0ABT0YLT5_9BURK|nr:gluconokinase [Caldimonas mangrovi]MCM5679689.1 gluconokinase [Caldimonas mangrovi]
MDSATHPSIPPARSLVVMGVAGCGKSSLGRACADALGWPLLEGDEYHSPENVAKMRAGIALTDADREGWLDRLGNLLQAAPHGAVLTCSALRQRYRDRLRSFVPGLRFAFLQLSEADAYARVASRPNHLFPPSLVASQFATLESPAGEPGVLSLDATRALDTLCQEVVAWMRHGGMALKKDRA